MWLVLIGLWCCEVFFVGGEFGGGGSGPFGLAQLGLACLLEKKRGHIFNGSYIYIIYFL